MAFTIPTFIVALFWLIGYMIQRLCISQIKTVNLLELIIDVVLTVWGLIANIVFSKYIGDISDFCGDGNGCWSGARGPAAVAAVVFAWFLMILLAVSVVLDVVTVMKPATSQAADAA
eukprot:UN02711